MGTAKPSIPIDLHLRVHLLPGMRDAFFEFLADAVPYYESPGGITIRLLEDTADDHRFIEVVHYEDESIYWQDQERISHDPEMKRHLERWRALLAEPPIVETYRHRTM